MIPSYIEFSFPLVSGPLSSHEVDGVRKEKEIKAILRDTAYEGFDWNSAQERQASENQGLNPKQRIVDNELACPFLCAVG